MKRLSFILLACFFTSFIYADAGIGLSENYSKRKRKSSFDKTKLFVGGALGGGSIQGGYIFNIAPSIGYQLTDRFHAGVNFGYFFSKQKVPYTDGSYEDFRNSVVTTSLFARYFPLDFLFVEVRPELNFIRTKYEYYYALTNYTEKDIYKTTIPSFLVGAAYVQRMGNSSYSFFSIMYDIVQNPNSPYYKQPIFGGGLALGLFGNR